jgi:hypothetical protein
VALNTTKQANIYNYFDKFKVNYTIFYDLTLFFHDAKLKRMKVKLKESFNLLLMKIYPDFSEINQIKICLSSINHEDEQISLLYINRNRRICTHALPVSDHYRNARNE